MLWLTALGRVRTEGLGAAAVRMTWTDSSSLRLACWLLGGIVLPLLGHAAAGLVCWRSPANCWAVICSSSAWCRATWPLSFSPGGVPHEPASACSGSTLCASSTPTPTIREFGYIVRARRLPTTGCRPPAATARSAAACWSASRTAKRSRVRGNPDHPVNRGKLCPKGLSEHHTLDAEEPRDASAADGQRQARAGVSWDEALDTMVAKFRGVQEKHGAGARASSAPASW